MPDPDPFRFSFRLPLSTRLRAHLLLAPRAAGWWLAQVPGVGFAAWLVWFALDHGMAVDADVLAPAALCALAVPTISIVAFSARYLLAPDPRGEIVPGADAAGLNFALGLHGSPHDWRALRDVRESGGCCSCIYPGRPRSSCRWRRCARRARWKAWWRSPAMRGFRSGWDERSRLALMTGAR